MLIASVNTGKYELGITYTAFDAWKVGSGPLRLLKEISLYTIGNFFPLILNLRMTTEHLQRTIAAIMTEGWLARENTGWRSCEQRLVNQARVQISCYCSISWRKDAIQIKHHVTRSMFRFKKLWMTAIYSYRCWSFSRLPSALGMLPLNWLLDRSSTCSSFILPMVSGMGPEIAFWRKDLPQIVNKNSSYQSIPKI